MLRAQTPRDRARRAARPPAAIIPGRWRPHTPRAAGNPPHARCPRRTPADTSPAASPGRHRRSCSVHGPGRPISRLEWTGLTSPDRGGTAAKRLQAGAKDWRRARGFLDMVVRPHPDPCHSQASSGTPPPARALAHNPHNAHNSLPGAPVGMALRLSGASDGLSAPTRRGPGPTSCAMRIPLRALVARAPVRGPARSSHPRPLGISGNSVINGPGRIASLVRGRDAASARRT